MPATSGRLGNEQRAWISGIVMCSSVAVWRVTLVWRPIHRCCGTPGATKALSLGRRDRVAPLPLHRLVTGTQYSDGRVTRNVTVYQLDADDSLTVEVAQALIDVADQAEQMNGNDQIGASENR